jgi:surfeit locus 1 family protein
VRKLALGALALLAVAGLVSLGVWQLQRRVWKLALIEQVDRRLAAAPVAAPRPDVWGRIGKADAYTRLTLHGSFRNDRATLVQAATVLGSGYWVLTPLVTDRGFTILVNRGFVSPEMKARIDAPAGPVTVTGLLRVSEPKGGFLRANNPAADRWYSRDVPVIAAKRSLGSVAPYFVDADAVPGASWPRGGLTVVAFPNSHLQYAITWFTMAAMLAFVSVRLLVRGTPPADQQGGGGS